MLAIVDANQAGNFAKTDSDHLHEFVRWVLSGGKVALGGRLTSELGKVGSFLPFLSQWRSSGRLILISDTLVNELENSLPPIKSDDPHVVALAIISDAKLIVTDDKPLMKDMKDLAVVGYRRKIYPCGVQRPKQIRSYKDLLRRL